MRFLAKIDDVLKPWLVYVSILIGLLGFGYTGYSNHQQYVRLQKTSCGFWSQAGQADRVLATQPTSPVGGDLKGWITGVAIESRHAYDTQGCKSPNP